MNISLSALFAYRFLKRKFKMHQNFGLEKEFLSIDVLSLNPTILSFSF